MPREQLRDDLQQLHDELGKLKGLDDGTRESLENVAQEVARYTESDETPAQHLVETIEARILTFDTDYPQISDVLRRMVSGLAALGA